MVGDSILHGRTRYCMEEHNYARNERTCNSYIQLLTGYVIMVCHNMYLCQITCSLVSSCKSESFCRFLLVILMTRTPPT